MATSKIFQKAPIEVPNRSGFNISHKSGFSAPVGTLVPFFWDFLLPKDEIDLGSAFQVQLPPLATDFIGDIEARVEYFSVPVRTLFGGWKDFIVNPLDDSNNPSDIEGQLAKYLIGCELNSSVSPAFDERKLDSNSSYKPFYFESGDLDNFKVQADKCIDHAETILSQLRNDELSIFLSDSTDVEYLKAGTLADYLGIKVDVSSVPGDLLSAYEAKKNDILNDVQERLESYRTRVDALTSPSTSIQWIDTTSNFTYNGVTFKVSATFRSRSNYGNELTCWFSITFTTSASTSSSIKINNILAFLAYHKIYDDWYRDSKIQKSLFRRQVANTTSASTVANMPWITSGAEQKIYFTGDQLLFANNHHLFELHQRNFEKDYFTSSTPEPQAGAPAKVSFDINNASGEFTIASLRAANGLQQFLDRNNIAGFRYGDVNFAQYGVYPPDEITQRAIYLGSQTIPVYNKSVYQQSGDGGTNTNNPFNIIGAKYANAMGVCDTNFSVNNYEVKDYCIVMGIFSLVPKVRYSSGTRRFFHYNDVSDIAFPMLAGVGDQEILKRELLDIYLGEGNTEVFGYTQRYAEYKFIDDQIHGLLRDGENLKSFALQRSFSGDVELGSDFITIPRDYLDQVSAADYEISKYGCWVDSKISYFKSSTLPAYSIPTLEDLKNTHTVIIDKNGKRL